MSRTPPPAPELPEHPKSDLIIEERTYRFLTPVFGGGVTPQHHDPITPIRVPAIRGQLRFWWRAVNPGGHTSVEALRKAEAKIFGDTEMRSRLVVQTVSQPSKPRCIPTFVTYGWTDKAKPKIRHLVGEHMAYGAFPLRDEEGKSHGSLLDYGDSVFSLRFIFDSSARDHMEAALWGWETFGGLGARTRRGFGAIERTDAVGTKLSVPTSPEAGRERWTGAGDVPWPHLVRAELGSKSFREGREAQSALLGELRAMRQGPGVGRRPLKKVPGKKGKRPGRSYWPEPDALRRLFKSWANKHRQECTTADAFPRAALGLPIVFHFSTKGDPEDCHLVASVNRQKAERWASPLILRPYRDSNKAVRALAAELAPRPRRALVYSQGRPRAEHDVRVPLEPGEVSSMPKPERAPFLDPIDAFFQRLP